MCGTNAGENREVPRLPVRVVCGRAKSAIPSAVNRVLPAWSGSASFWHLCTSPFRIGQLSARLRGRS